MKWWNKDVKINVILYIGIWYTLIVLSVLLILVKEGVI